MRKVCNSFSNVISQSANFRNCIGSQKSSIYHANKKENKKQFENFLIILDSAKQEYAPAPRKQYTPCICKRNAKQFKSYPFCTKICTLHGSKRVLILSIMYLIEQREFFRILQKSDNEPNFSKLAKHIHSFYSLVQEGIRLFAVTFPQKIDIR